MFHVKHPDAEPDQNVSRETDGEKMEQRETLEKAFASAGLPLTGTQIDAFLKYALILQEWNLKFNLTAVTEFEEIVTRHFLDSAAPVFEAFLPEGRIIDVGSGAGFPGIPLKILCPDREIVLLDSLRKRVGFLEHVIGELELKGIAAVHGRAEDLARDAQYREKFDLATARAVAPLNVLTEFCVPFIRTGGEFLAYKSEAAENELQTAKKALKTLGIGPVETRFFLLPGTEYRRCLIRAVKTKPTPAVYPRKAGTVSKKPL